MLESYGCCALLSMWTSKHYINGISVDLNSAPLHHVVNSRAYTSTFQTTLLGPSMLSYAIGTR